MSNILDTIQVSGASYDLKDKNAPSVSSLTQSEYDNLPSTAKTSNTFFVITDAQAGDLTNYYTKSETNTLLGGKQATLVSGTNIKTINNESILGSGNIDIQGGSTYTAGDGIDITNDVISVSGVVATSAITSAVTSASTNSEIPTAKAVYDAIPTGGTGGGKAISGGTNISVTTGETADTINCTLPIVVSSFGTCLDLTYGSGNDAKGSRAITLGAYTKTTNSGELAIGRYNVSNYTSAAPTYNNPNKTVFSVGNGTSNNARHNAFEIRQNGDIYCSDGTNDVKLQEYLQIKAVKISQSDYDALVQGGTVDANTLYIITNVVS